MAAVLSLCVALCSGPVPSAELGAEFMKTAPTLNTGPPCASLRVALLRGPRAVRTADAQKVSAASLPVANVGKARELCC